MTSYRQMEANRRNALRSTGPTSPGGKQRSRCNAVRHGLTAETVIGVLEDTEGYKAFEAAITADYDAQSAVERELVLRLASLLWRLRRATMMETGLFDIQAEHSITKSVALQQDTTGFTDLIPIFADRWNAGVNNYMVYLTGDIPVGLYSSSNLANIGIGHGAIDGG